MRYHAKEEKKKSPPDTPGKLRDAVHTNNGRYLKQAQTYAKVQAQTTFYIYLSIKFNYESRVKGNDANGTLT